MEHIKPTDAELLKELARQYDEEIEPNWPNRIWDRVEIAAARGRDYLSGARPMPDTKLCGAATHVGEDHKFRTCEKPAGHSGMHETTICGLGWSWIPDTPAPDEVAPELGAECEHGHLRRKCPHCELIASEAEVARLTESVKFWKDGWYNLNQDYTRLTARVAELERRVALADLAIRLERKARTMRAEHDNDGRGTKEILKEYTANKLAHDAGRAYFASATPAPDTQGDTQEGRTSEC